MAGKLTQKQTRALRYGILSEVEHSRFEVSHDLDFTDEVLGSTWSKFFSNLVLGK